MCDSLDVDTLTVLLTCVDPERRDILWTYRGAAFVGTCIYGRVCAYTCMVRVKIVSTFLPASEVTKKLLGWLSRRRLLLGVGPENSF